MNAPIEDNVPSTDSLRESYDEIPYPSHPKPFTHIARLAAIGNLRGLTPAPPTDCRVLELGCADGGNLLPMAVHFCNSRFVGIDLSAVQIEIGSQKAKALSLANLELRPADIQELAADDLGRFDYIIAHGVYSWVPSRVQQRILSICRDHLDESGLAYISYNTYPGWRGKQALREMLRYHTRQVDDLRDKVDAALQLVARLPTPAESPGDPGAILAERLRHDLENIDNPVTYLIHEYLIDVNEPIYFSNFLSRVEASALRYVDDAFPASTALDRLPPAARQWVSQRFADYFEQQQYVDFICNVSFRRSLLCHSNLPVERQATWRRLQPLHATATCRREESDDAVPRFITDPGRRFSAEHPGLQMILERLLDVHPASLPVGELRDALGSHVADEEAAAIFDGLLMSAAVEFTSHPRCCTRIVGERPWASRLARYQAESGLVTNAAHRPVRLEDAFERHLLQSLDGTLTVPELSSLLQKRLTPDKPISDAEWDALVREHLSRLAELGLLGSAEGNPPA